MEGEQGRGGFIKAFFSAKKMNERHKDKSYYFADVVLDLG
jgi:hypothetical protein